jgi:phosphopantetheinyl transferase (holo-ACP synthase)
MEEGQNRRRHYQRRSCVAKKVFGKVMRTGQIDTLESSISSLAKRGLLKKAAQKAVEKQLANGVPAVWLEEDTIYKLHPDGRKERLAFHKQKSNKLTRQRFFIKK